MESSPRSCALQWVCTLNPQVPPGMQLWTLDPPWLLSVYGAVEWVQGFQHTRPEDESPWRWFWTLWSAFDKRHAPHTPHSVYLYSRAAVCACLYIQPLQLLTGNRYIKIGHWVLSITSNGDNVCWFGVRVTFWLALVRRMRCWALLTLLQATFHFNIFKSKATLYRENTPQQHEQRTQVLGSKLPLIHVVLTLTTKDTSLRIELFGRKGVPIRGGPLHTVCTVWTAKLLHTMVWMAK